MVGGAELAHVVSVDEIDGPGLVPPDEQVPVGDAADRGRQSWAPGLRPVVISTPVATSGWAKTCPSTCTWKSLPNVDTFTLLGVNCVSVESLPVLVGPS
jgi:hypothetical protein